MAQNVSEGDIMTPSADEQPGECSHEWGDYGWSCIKCGHNRASYEATFVRPAAAPVWRPCNEHPPIGKIVELRHYLGGCDDEYGIWRGTKWQYTAFKDGRGCIPLDDPQNYQWLDPAPGHEEQRESKADHSPQNIRVNAQRSQAVEPADSHPTIEQDRQAWRAWFGAYSEPVKPFGSR